MATYSNGGTQSYAESISLDTMMNILKDNVGNEISAEDVRWSAFTLWDKIEGVSASISEYTYSNPNPITSPLGGFNSGTTFSNITLTQLFNTLFYPYVAPGISLLFQAGQVPKEFGSTPTVNVNYSVIKKSDIINTIVVGGTNVVPPGVQPYDLNINGLLSVSITPNVNTVIDMTVNSGVGITSSTSVTATWTNGVYVFGLASITPYDLTLNPSDSSIIGAGITASMGNTTSTNIVLSDITSGQFTSSTLQVGVRKVLKTNRLATYTTIGGGNKHIALAWPTSYGTPVFEVNGLPNTAFTKVVSGYSLKNSWGYIVLYDVWITNTPLNSTINTLKIT